MAVNDIDGVVDVERHRLGRGLVAGAIEIDHDPHQANKVGQPGRVLPARDGRLRAQIGAAVGQPAASELEPRIGAQPVEVVGVLIAAGDGKDAGAQDIGQQMGNPVGVATVRDQPGEPLGKAEPPLGLGEQHNATIRTDPPAIKGGGDLLARDGWKREWQQDIFSHGGCGRLRCRNGMASTPNSYTTSDAYAISASHKTIPS